MSLSTASMRPFCSHSNRYLKMSARFKFRLQPNCSELNNWLDLWFSLLHVFLSEFAPNFGSRMTPTSFYTFSSWVQHDENATVDSDDLDDNTTTRSNYDESKMKPGWSFSPPRLPALQYKDCLDLNWSKIIFFGCAVLELCLIVREHLRESFVWQPIQQLIMSSCILSTCKIHMKGIVILDPVWT